MTPARKAQFFSQFATMTRGGMTLSQSLVALQASFPEKIVGDMAREIEAGNPLPQIFERTEFTSFEQELVAAGEQTGQWTTSFAVLADYWQREHDLAQALRGALIYPVVLLHAVILLGPIALLLESPGRYLMTALVNLGGLYFVGIILFQLGRRLWREPVGQAWLLRLPWVGKFWRSLYALRWVQIVRLEFEAGIPLPQATAAAWRGTGARLAGDFVVEVEQQLRAGTPLSDVLPQWPLLPRGWVSYVQAGEVSGQLSETFQFLNQEAEKDHQRARQQVIEWLPRLVGGGVMLIVIVQIILFYLDQIGKVSGLLDQM